jgi:multicomponent Na+:H+ antiporter subunit B
MVLLAMLVALAIIIAQSRSLFAAAMLFMIFSLLSAGIYTVMDAVDVAFTEAAVGAGFSTVLILGTLAMTSTEERNQPFRFRPLLAVLAVGGTLLYGARDLPAYGDPEAAIHHHLAPDYIEGTEHDIHMPNIVTAILASYRGYDTFGETTVIFTAGVGVILLLSGRRRKRDGRNDERPATEPAIAAES